MMRITSASAFEEGLKTDENTNQKRRVVTAVDDYRADIFIDGETVTTRPSGWIWRRMSCWTRRGGW